MIPFAEKTIKKSATPFNFPLTRSRQEGIILYWYIYLSKNGHHCGVIFYNFYLKSWHNDDPNYTHLGIIINIVLLKSVFSEIRVRTWVQVVPRIKIGL